MNTHDLVAFVAVVETGSIVARLGPSEFDAARCDAANSES
jgi:hypothetical protein